MLKITGKFMRDESGATAIEYGLIAGLVAVVIVGALTTMGTNLTPPRSSQNRRPFLLR